MRPRQIRGEAKREEILEIARAEFLGAGYAATSMSTIAARLGGSKGTLYNHFKSKEELFCAVIERDCAERVEAVFQGLRDTHPIEKALRQLGLTLLRLLTQPETLAVNRVVYAEAPRLPELGRVLYEAGPSQGTRRIAAKLEEAMNAGELRRADPYTAALHFKGMCVADLHLQHLMGVAPPVTEKQLADVVDAALDVFMRAYGPAAEAGAVD